MGIYLLKIKWSKVKFQDDIEIYDGMRIITIEIKTVIPPYIYILNVKVRAFFKHQQRYVL